MRTRDWLVILGVVAAPLFACSSSDSAAPGDGGTGGSGGGSVKTDGGTAGKAGSGTAGAAGAAGGGGVTCADGNVCEVVTDDGTSACITAAGDVPANAQTGCDTTPCADGYECFEDADGTFCLQMCGDVVADPCPDCQKAKCSAESAACGANAACKTVLTCANACKDMPCIEACKTATPDGAADFQSMFDCVFVTQCKAECGG